MPRPRWPRSSQLVSGALYKQLPAIFQVLLASQYSKPMAICQLSSSQEALVLAALGPATPIARIGESRDRPSRARCPVRLEGRSLHKKS